MSHQACHEFTVDDVVYLMRNNEIAEDYIERVSIEIYNNSMQVTETRVIYYLHSDPKSPVLADELYLTPTLLTDKLLYKISGA